MCRIARGIDRAQLEREPSLMTVINTSSPLRLDLPMAAGIIEMARAGQIVVLTPFTLAGAMAPVTVAGAVAQQNAEALLGIALTQLVRPGAPVIYGGFTSNVDMKSGAPAFGTPEYMKSVLVGGQLARRYKLPYRSSNTCAANSVDGQAMYEFMFSLWAVVMGRGNLVKHSAGWLEGGLCSSFEKLVIDVDTLQMVASFLEPLQVDDRPWRWMPCAKSGRAGISSAAPTPRSATAPPSTRRSCRTGATTRAGARPGAPDAARHANRIYKEMVASYEPPPIDPGVKEELDAFVDRRVREGGAPSEF